MSYKPQFTISSRLLSLVETVAALRERIQGAAVELSWIPALQKDTRTRNVHASTAIEGNPLTLEQVRALEEGRELVASDQRSQREVLNYFAGLRYVEKNAGKKTIVHEDVLKLHRILAAGVMDQGEAGRYRTIAVRVGRYVPPAPGDVSGLMFELLKWWSNKAVELSPVLSLALWELYRRGFDTHHIFSVDEYYWEDRPRYYAALEAARRESEDLTGWLEYCAEGLRQTLERVWLRVQTFNLKSREKLVLRPKQERLLQLLRDHGSMSPLEIWTALEVSRQGAMDLLRPLLQGGLVEKIGGKKTGRYALSQS